MLITHPSKSSALKLFLHSKIRISNKLQSRKKWFIKKTHINLSNKKLNKRLLGVHQSCWALLVSNNTHLASESFSLKWMIIEKYIIFDNEKNCYICINKFLLFSLKFYLTRIFFIYSKFMYFVYLDLVTRILCLK